MGSLPDKIIWPASQRLSGGETKYLPVDWPQAMSRLRWKRAVIMIVHGKLAAKGSTCGAVARSERLQRGFRPASVLLLSANLPQHARRVHRGGLTHTKLQAYWSIPLRLSPQPHAHLESISLQTGVKAKVMALWVQIEAICGYSPDYSGVKGSTL